MINSFVVIFDNFYEDAFKNLTDATKQKRLERSVALVRRFKVCNTNLLRNKMSRLSYQRSVDSKFTEPKHLVIPWLGATLNAVSK